MSTTGDGRTMPAARAVLVAVLSLAIAAAGHAAAGGAVPTGTGLAALSAVTFAAGVVLGRRRLSYVTLVPVLGALQLVLHHGFALLGAAGGAPATPGGHAAHGAHDGHGAHAAHAAGHVDASLAAGVHGPHGVGPAWMVAAHAAAVVVTAVLLVGADSGARGVARWWAWVAPLLLRPAAPAVGRTGGRRPTPHVRTRPRLAWLAGAAPRRGPPAGAPAAC